MARLPMDVTTLKTDYSQDPKFTEAIAKGVYYGLVYFRRMSGMRALGSDCSPRRPDDDRASAGRRIR